MGKKNLIRTRAGPRYNRFTQRPVSPLAAAATTTTLRLGFAAVHTAGDRSGRHFVAKLAISPAFLPRSGNVEAGGSLQVPARASTGSALAWYGPSLLVSPLCSLPAFAGCCSGTSRQLMLLAGEKIMPDSGFSRVAYAQPFHWMIQEKSDSVVSFLFPLRSSSL